MGAWIAYVALLGTAALLAWALARAVADMWRRAMRDDRPLPLSIMMRRLHIEPAAAAAASGFALGAAARRCAACPAEAECRAWLASGRHEGYERFCPNAAWLDRARGTAG